MPDKPSMLFRTAYRSPLGSLTLIASDLGLRAILWPRTELRSAGISGRVHLEPEHPILRRTAEQLDQYFNGTRTSFDIPLDLVGTRFQLAAWRALASIPFGTTTSYGRQAAALGMPGAARALGAANGANPVCIVLPCHRVIGADGSLTGFGGGLPAKAWLLDHEARIAAGTIDSTPGWQPNQHLQTRLSMPVA
jgi:methylated-DNA-[protein]-cysteine S-methyltransferase